MTPLEYYQQQVQTGAIQADANQLVVMEYLQRLQTGLLQEQQRRSSIVSFLSKPKLVKGIYLWGGVGIGKTFMMDCFYHTLPFPQKMRMHFHQFMQLIHNQLKAHQGERDPLLVIAKELAQKAMVLCFDELFVSDITDAMLLGRLFKALFDRGVCLVTTSNAAPDDLYKNGLQRLNFLPAIALLKAQTEVVHIPTTVDYRLRHLQEAGVFYTPLNEESAHKIEKTFAALTQGKEVYYGSIDIAGRQIKIVKATTDVVWFQFADICHVPRSQKDYLLIAAQYKTVFISDIPLIDEKEKDTICLFISLVDVMYDARVRLVISAAEPVESIYHRGHMIMEFARTNSRLQEMQSVDYFTGEFE